jgi:hypothetical protein
VLSLETAVRMLADAGFPIDNVEDEIKQIQARAFDQAKNLADATGSTDAVGNFLGIKVNPDPTPPTVQLPPIPGQDPNTPAVDPARGSGGNE